MISGSAAVGLTGDGEVSCLFLMLLNVRLMHRGHRPHAERNRVIKMSYGEASALRSMCRGIEKHSRSTQGVLQGRC